MAQDYIPGGDAAFDVWQANFLTYAAAHLADLGLVAGDLTDATVDQTAWNAALAAHVAAAAAAHAARSTKDSVRADLESDIRPLVRRIQANPGVDNAHRAALDITVADSQPTPAPPPATRPVCRVDSGQRLRHVVHFADEATPTRRAKPAGVRGAEVWVKIGPTPPVDPSELTFLGLDTRTPYLAEFEGEDGGKLAHYMLRWQNTRGEPGPWSETASATIGQ